jgi:uncharacterized protein YecE (DUF72 family)
VARQHTLRVGTASWSDPGFVRDWYPPKLPASERLPWYAERFNLVEVNSTFYGIPSQDTVRAWCERTPKDFIFNVKPHRLLSRHSTKVEYLPSGLRSIAEVSRGKALLTPALEEATVKVMLESLAPMVDAGKFGAFLLQLSPSFDARKHSLHELDDLLGFLHGQRVAIELRNRSWVVGEQFEETMRFFKKHRLAFVCVDGPVSGHFMVMPPVDEVTTPRLAYLRAHGRNTEGYIRGQTVAERFDYDYSDAEVAEIEKRAVGLSRLANETHVIFNNNKSNYALKAAERFRRISGQ